MCCLNILCVVYVVCVQYMCYECVCVLFEYLCVVYVVCVQYMCYEGGKRAITGLNGYLLHQLSKPLLVELSHEVSVYYICTCLYISDHR